MKARICPEFAEVFHQVLPFLKVLLGAVDGENSSDKLQILTG